MMQPRVSDAQVLSILGELRNSGKKVTGSRLRSELRRRYGAPGGVGRVYRLLQQEPGADGHGETIAQLERERDSAIERAAKAEAREEAHQTLWAAQIDALREEVRRLKGPRQSSDASFSTLLDQIKIGQRRIAELESQLQARDSAMPSAEEGGGGSRGLSTDDK